MSEDTNTPFGVASIEDNESREARIVLAQHRIDPGVVAKLRNEHGRRPLYVLTDQPVIFLAMTNAQFERLGKVKEADRVKGSRELVSYLVVYPEPQAWQDMIGDTSGTALLWSTVLEAATIIASGKKTGDAKKL